MKLKKKKLEGLYELDYGPFFDHRGMMAKPFNKISVEELGFDFEVRQVIHSRNTHKNTIRGMYVQSKPFVEGKIVAPLYGEIYWVVVDVRLDSPTYGHWEGTYVSPETEKGLFITPGFAHGCMSVTDNSAVLLMADNDHAPENSFGFAWNDPDVGIEWPAKMSEIEISDIHNDYPSFKEFDELYRQKNEC